MTLSYMYIIGDIETAFIATDNNTIIHTITYVATINDVDPEFKAVQSSCRIDEEGDINFNFSILSLIYNMSRIMSIWYLARSFRLPKYGVDDLGLYPQWDG